VGAVNNGTTLDFLLLGAILTGVEELEFGLDVMGGLGLDAMDGFKAVSESKETEPRSERL